MDKGHPEISMRRQSKLLSVARSTADYKPAFGSTFGGTPKITPNIWEFLFF
jgi:hypothetical protein